MKIRLTYHAVRRYLERVEGINLKPVFAEMRRQGYRRWELMTYLENEFGLTETLLSLAILPKKVKRSAAICGGNAMVNHNGHTYVLRDSNLVTITPR